MSRGKKKTNWGLIIFVLIMVYIIFSGTSSKDNNTYTNIKNTIGIENNKTFNLISSQENKDFDAKLKEIAFNRGINLNIEYAGTLDMMEKINMHPEDYDAVWNSNAIWNYMLDNSSIIKNAKSISVNPVVFGIKKSKAESLGLVGRSIYTQDIVNVIKDGSLNFSMSNPTQTNSGATTYLGLLSVLAGNPEVLKESDIENEELRSQMVEFFSNLNRSSGSEDFLEEIALTGDYDAVATYEFSLINMNKKLVAEGKEPFYLLYPEDGVSIANSPFAYIDNGNEEKEETFEVLQEYLLSDAGQKNLQDLGRRTWLGGITNNVDTNIFNPAWGINTEKYIVPIRTPSKDIIVKALTMYQVDFRRPCVTVFGLDYSGSMSKTGKTSLVEAMNYVLDEEKASQSFIQYSDKDIIIVIPFSSDVINVWRSEAGENRHTLMNEIRSLAPYGSTNIYDTCIRGLKELKDYDQNQYSVSIILMTDGQSNRGTFDDLKKYYRTNGNNIPIYSILFGDAVQKELDKIADLTGGKVFDGKDDLLKVFKEVRGYN